MNGGISGINGDGSGSVNGDTNGMGGNSNGIINDSISGIAGLDLIDVDATINSIKSSTDAISQSIDMVHEPYNNPQNKELVTNHLSLRPRNRYVYICVYVYECICE